MSSAIPGLKLIFYTGKKDIPDDPKYPWRMDVCRGTEEIRVRGMTREALEEFSAMNGLSTNPRLRSFQIRSNSEIEGYQRPAPFEVHDEDFYSAYRFEVKELDLSDLEE